MEKVTTATSRFEELTKRKVDTLEEVTLKRVLYGEDGMMDVPAKFTKFNERDDTHVIFAYAYADLMSGVPSPLKDLMSASQEYVRIFMARTETEEKDGESAYSRVLAHLPSCRRAFLRPEVQKALNDFFASV